LHHEQNSADQEQEAIAVSSNRSVATNFVEKEMPRGRLARRATRIRSRKTPKKINVLSGCGAKRQILPKKKFREADHAPSGSHQEQKDSQKDKCSVAVWSEAKLRDKNKRKGRPATGRPSLSRENSSNGVRKRPSELSGEILLASERQCQGIFRE